jgi:uncharacterized protein (DUF1501 family)
MKPEKQISRRDLIASVSALAMTSAVMPKFLHSATSQKDGFVIVNGWVLKRSEAA